MRAAALLTLLLTLSACAPKADSPPPAAVALDCGKPFDALVGAVTSQPGIVAAPRVSGEPYRAYNMEDGRASYLVTEQGAPGHPAILMQQAANEGGRTVMKNSGCPYGDKQGYDALMTYLTGLKAGGK